MKIVITLTLFTFVLSSLIDFVAGVAERFISGEKAHTGLIVISFVEIVMAITSLVFMAYV